MSYTTLKKRFIASPLNYVGGKYRLLTQLFPLFPKDINIALDLFCGGANVGINMSAREIILNDSLSELTKLYQAFQQENSQIIFHKIWHIIDEFKLSNTAKYIPQNIAANFINAIVPKAYQTIIKSIF